MPTDMMINMLSRNLIININKKRKNNPVILDNCLKINSLLKSIMITLVVMMIMVIIMMMILGMLIMPLIVKTIVVG